MTKGLKDVDQLQFWPISNWFRPISNWFRPISNWFRPISNQSRLISSYFNAILSICWWTMSKSLKRRPQRCRSTLIQSNFNSFQHQFVQLLLNNVEWAPKNDINFDCHQLELLLQLAAVIPDIRSWGRNQLGSLAALPILSSSFFFFFFFFFFFLAFVFCLCLPFFTRSQNSQQIKCAGKRQGNRTRSGYSGGNHY